MQIFKLLVIFLTVSCGAYCKVPTYIKPCKRNDPNLSACIVANYNASRDFLIQNGEPNLKLPNMHKFIVPRIAMQATKELQVSLMNITFTGLDSLEMTEMMLKDDVLTVKAFLPRLEYIGDYDLKGKILILPIEGQGTMNITQIGSECTLKAKLKIEERKGKKYYHAENTVEDTEFVIQKVKLMVWQFDNLFGGDPRLGPEMNRFLNDNWEDVYKEVKNALEQGAAYTLINPYINGYFKHMAIDELFSD